MESKNYTELFVRHAKEHKIANLFEDQVNRAQELKKFWPGFVDFSYENPSLGKDLIYKILRAGDSSNTQLNDESTERATERALLFCYGATLAQDLNPQIGKKLEMPSLSITNKDEFFSYCYRKKQNKLEHSGFEVGLNSLVGIYGLTSQMIPFMGERSKTVSSQLYDWEVVQLVNSGVEEYAHYAYISYKNTDTIGRMEKVREKNAREYKKIKSNDLIRADVIYHSDDTERRALTWQKAVLNKYLPSWGFSTESLLSYVSEERLKRMEKGYVRKEKFKAFVDSLLGI